VEVAFGSDEYFALLKEHAAAAPWLSLLAVGATVLLMARWLRDAGYPAEIQPTREGLYHVRILQLASREDAEALAESLRGKHGIAEPLVTN